VETEKVSMRQNGPSNRSPRTDQEQHTAYTKHTTRYDDRTDNKDVRYGKISFTPIRGESNHGGKVERDVITT